MSKIVNVYNISLKYQSKNGEIDAISDVSFSVEKGEYISIVGPSGCGKTSLLSIICGLISPTSGKVFIDGTEITKPGPLIGFMPQNDHLFDWRTVFGNILVGLEVQKKRTKENVAYALDLLKTYGLYEFKDKYPSQLSVGMRQRVALIRTLTTHPHILLLDEPFASLDYQTRLAVADDIYFIIKNERKTAVMVTHDISESVSMSDRVLVLSKRPAVLKSIHDIKFEHIRRTPINCRKEKEFSVYFNQILKELDVHV